jgi:hypothetical protein
MVHIILNMNTGSCFCFLNEFTIYTLAVTRFSLNTKPKFWWWLVLWCLLQIRHGRDDILLGHNYVYKLKANHGIIVFPTLLDLIMVLGKLSYRGTCIHNSYQA